MNASIRLGRHNIRLNSLIPTLLMAVWGQMSFTEEPASKMPPDAAKVIEKYDKAAEAAKKTYDAAMTKAREQALKDLKPIQTSETKKGNLDGALQVKEKIDELSADASSETIPPVKEPKAFVWDKTAIASLVGTWVGEGGRKGGPNWKFAMAGRDIQFTEDKENGRTSAKTTFTNDGKIIFKWFDNSDWDAYMEVIRVDKDKLSLTMINKKRGTDDMVWSQFITKNKDK